MPASTSKRFDSETGVLATQLLKTDPRLRSTLSINVGQKPGTITPSARNGLGEPFHLGPAARLVGSQLVNAYADRPAGQLRMGRTADFGDILRDYRSSQGAAKAAGGTTFDDHSTAQRSSPNASSANGLNDSLFAGQQSEGSGPHSHSQSGGRHHQHQTGVSGVTPSSPAAPPTPPGERTLRSSFASRPYTAPLQRSISEGSNGSSLERRRSIRWDDGVDPLLDSAAAGGSGGSGVFSPAAASPVQSPTAAMAQVVPPAVGGAGFGGGRVGLQRQQSATAAAVAAAVRSRPATSTPSLPSQSYLTASEGLREGSRLGQRETPGAAGTQLVGGTYRAMTATIGAAALSGTAPFGRSSAPSAAFAYTRHKLVGYKEYEADCKALHGLNTWKRSALDLSSSMAIGRPSRLLSPDEHMTTTLGTLWTMRSLKT